jgi:hypothetical protein
MRNAFEIILMFGLGLPEITDRLHFGDNFSRPYS